MTKKLLLGIHHDLLESSYKLHGKMAGYEVITPAVPNSTPSMIEALEQNPTRVIMDINYGHPRAHDIAPILEVALAMKNRGYDVQKSLFGITGLHGDLIARLNADGIPSSMKHEITPQRLKEFLSE